MNGLRDHVYATALAIGKKRKRRNVFRDCRRERERDSERGRERGHRETPGCDVAGATDARARDSRFRIFGSAIFEWVASLLAGFRNRA